MRSSFKLSISLCFGLGSVCLLLVFLLSSLEVVRGSGEVMGLSSSIRQESLPEILESQRMAVNIENLRRHAEIVLSSVDARQRRQARIDAKALAMEANFLQGGAFAGQTAEVIGLIDRLAKEKSSLRQQQVRRLRGLVQECHEHVHWLAAQLDEREQAGLLQAFRASSFSLADQGSSSPGAFETFIANRASLTEQDAALHTLYYKLLNSRPKQTLLPHSDMNQLFADYDEALVDLGLVFNRAMLIWQEIDNHLRIMRDAVASGAEYTVNSALLRLEERALSSRHLALGTVGAGLLLLALLLYLVHRHIVRPLHWLGQKLGNLQHQVLDDKRPKIRVTELDEVAELLDRFSLHLAELYSHTTRLREDAAGKKLFEEIMRSVFQVSLDGFCVWRPGEVLMGSEGLMRHFDLYSQGDLNKMVSEVRFSVQAMNQAVYDEVLQHGLQRLEITARTPKGRVFPCEVTRLPLEANGQRYILSYFRDLTAQKHTEDELRQARDAAEAAAEAKSSFLARMSHEIRTPMNGVLGLTHLALQREPTPKQRQYLEKIQASARILLRVINDILDFSKIESGSFSLARENFSFSNMLGTVRDLVQGQAAAKGLDFIIERGQGIPEQLRGDEVRLAQVLLNLCGNSVKFTERGEVRLNIEPVPLKDLEEAGAFKDPALLAEAEQSGTGLTALRFSVRDTGIGMSGEDLSCLFLPFSQADVSATRKYGGTGLGLVISRMLVRMMHGDITVESEPGQGSTFSFIVLLENEPEAAREAENGTTGNAAATGADTGTGTDTSTGTSTGTATQATAPLTPENLQGLVVLLAEDNLINQEIAVELLESYGVTVLVAGNGQEALNILESRPPGSVDAVLMDIEMPVLDGLSTARRIREHPNKDLRDLPIIAMTAHAMQENREKSLAARMNAHITKPIDVEELVAKLLEWVAPARLR